MCYQCIFCLIRSFEKLLQRYSIKDEIKEKLVFEFISYLVNISSFASLPEVTRQAYHLVMEAIQDPDPYKEEKRQCNDLVLNRYEELKETVQEFSSPFNSALQLSLAGNIMDIATVPEFFKDCSKSLDESLINIWTKDFAIDHSDELKNRLDNSKLLLVLGDNCGEAVMDKLFLETIQHPNVYYAVRGGPVLNDVTMEDAKYIGLDSVSHIISNGYDAPSTLLEHASDEFIDVFNHADVIISKGQGNFEGLLNQKTNKHIFFLMMAKCNVIADHLGVHMGDYVVVHNHERVFSEMLKRMQSKWGTYQTNNVAQMNNKVSHT